MALSASLEQVQSLVRGAHVVEVKKSGFKDYKKEIEVRGGAELSLRATLEKQ